MQDRLPTWTLPFSEARWLNRKRVAVYSRVFVAVYAAAIVIVLALSPHFIDPLGKPVGADFLCFWTAGKMALDGHAVEAFDYRQLFVMEQKAMPWKDGQTAPRLPWLYPPMFMILAAALAWLPYGAALGAWLAATLAIYLAAIRGILPGREALIVALAFPAVLSNLAHGQNGFLTAGLLGGALLLLERSPWTSGVLFGLLAYKPQFALVIPLALVVGRWWRAIMGAGLTVLGTVALSWAIFGGEAWRAFLDSLTVTRTSGLEQGAAGWEKIQSIFSAVRMLGGSVELAYAAQAVMAVAAVAAVVWIWRKPTDSLKSAAALKYAALATAALMVTPYVLDYDLIVLALPIAWLTASGLRDGFLSGEKIILLAVWLLPLLSRAMGEYLHLPLAPVAMALLLAMILRRAATASSTEWAYGTAVAVEGA